MTEHLRPWLEDDAAALLSIAVRNPDLVRQFGELSSVTEAAALINSWSAQVESGTGLIWAIVEPADSPVGAVGVTAIEPRHRTGWCWYWLDAAARGRGLATAALISAAAAAFDRDVHRLELAHRVNNPASCRVATRAGFVAEGIERSRLEYDGVRYDCETHARLATDPAVVAAGLPIRSPNAD